MVKRYNQHLSVVMRLATFLLLANCAPDGGKPAPTANGVARIPSQNWVKVESRPPTYFPQGVAADTPTGFSEGEWVFTEDTKQCRYFIPFHGLGGLSRQALIQEALAARTPQRVNRNERENRALATKEIISNTIGVPITILSGMGVR